MKEVKDIIFERRITNLEIDGKQVPDKYISVFNSYLEQIAESLSDYTKQVRKEVLNKIRKWHDEECESLDLDSDFDVGYSGALSNLWGVLDQIEGKPKD